MLDTLFTIGYEGADLDEVIHALCEQQVDEVVDVRFTPISRKRGFSKTSLSRSLAAERIEYSHRREFGCPKSIRQHYHLTGNFAWYAAAYRDTILAIRGRETDDLLRKAAVRRVCLLCFEKDAQLCHRSLLANEIVRLSRGKLKSVNL